MRLVFLSIAPEFFESYLASHAVELARRQGHSVEVADLRDFADGSFRQVSDSPFGGGRGVVLRALPIFRAVEALTGRRLQERPGRSPVCSADRAPLCGLRHARAALRAL